MQFLYVIIVFLYIIGAYCEPDVESLLAYNKALEYHRTNDNDNALKHYLLAISHDISFPEAHQNLGLLYESMGDIRLSMHHHDLSIKYAASTEFKSSSIVNFVLVNLRSAPILSNDENEKLISMLLEAQALNPADDNIEFTIGLIRDQMGQPEAAMQCFRRIILINPNHSLALMNIGNHYFRQSLYSLSSQYYEQTLRTLPENDQSRRILALNNLGQSYREQGLYNAALKSFLQSEAIQRSSDERTLKSTIQFYSVNNVYTMEGLLCKWKDYELYEHLIESFLLDAFDNPTLAFNSNVNLHNLIDPYTMSLMRFSSLPFDKTVCKSACTGKPVYDYTKTASTSPADSSTVLRVGYLSFDWRDHPMGRLTSHLVTSHNASRVLSHSFSYGSNDGSPIRQMIEKESPAFVDLSQVRNDFDAAALVSSKQLDILIDITSHTYNGRINIAALKPAPVVINYLGFPGTTGCPGFDYSMVNKVTVPPEGIEGFSEKLIYLPHSYQANSMPLSVPPCSGGRAECKRERKLFAVDSYFGTASDPETLLVKHSRSEVQWICSFNANKKMEPLSFHSWTNILMRVPSAILILLDIPFDARKELLLLCSYNGISHSRVLFIGRQSWLEHLHRTAACDLVLDTFVYGAHTTSSDVLWMHVPIVTLSSFGSGRMPSRVAGSILGSLIPEGDSSSPLNLLIANSVREYEDIAVRVLRDGKLLSKLHERIAVRSLTAPTFNRYLMEDDIEKSYQVVHDLRVINRVAHVVIPRSLDTDSMLLPAMEEIRRHLLTSKAASTCATMKELSYVWQCMVRNVEKDDLDVIKASAVSQRLLTSFPNHPQAQVWKQIVTRSVLPNVFLPAMEVDSLVNMVKGLYPRRFDVEFAEELLEYSHKIRRFVESDVQSTLLAVLDAQAAMTNDCEEDQILFDTVASVLFVDCNALGLLAYVTGSQLQLMKQVLQSAPASLSPSAYHCPAQGIPTHLYIVLAHILHNHALCAKDAWAGPNSLERFVRNSVSALALYFSLDALQGYGLSLMDTTEGRAAAETIEYGYQVASLAFVNLHLGKYSQPPSLPTRTAATSVVFYCYEFGQSWWPGWGPSTIRAGQGLGGSEEAVYQTAIELSRLGYHVSIYSEIPAQDTGQITHENPSGGYIHWLHHSNLDLTQSYDIFIAWRYSLSLSFGKLVAKRRYLWLHDLVPGNVLPQSVFSEHDGVFVQSTFHKQYVLHEVAKYGLTDQSTQITNKVYITHNGISLPSEDFGTQPLKNDNNMFIFGSAPNRGLGLVLHAWPQIKQNIPEATLEVYYGFTEAVVKYMKTTMGVEAFAKWYDQVMVLLKQDGVHYHGSVDPDTLLEAYQRAGFWLYPTTFQETGCITGIKAMASGAIPITSRLQESVLIELTDRYDLGPSVPLNLTTAGNTEQLTTWLNKEWVPAILRAHQFTKEQLDSHRAVMRYEVTQEYTWKNTALKLSALFKRDLKV